MYISNKGNAIYVTIDIFVLYLILLIYKILCKRWKEKLFICNKSLIPKRNIILSIMYAPFDIVLLYLILLI